MKQTSQAPITALYATLRRNDELQGELGSAWQHFGNKKSDSPYSMDNIDNGNTAR